MTSGASQRGLLAEMELDLTCWVSTRDRLKSPTFTRQCLSTSKLADLRSLWMICLLCSCSIPWAAQQAGCHASTRLEVHDWYVQS